MIKLIKKSIGILMLAVMLLLCGYFFIYILMGLAVISISIFWCLGITKLMDW